VGIGTSSPNNYTNYVALTLNGTNGGEIDFEKAGTVNGSLFNPSGTSDFQVTAANASGNLRFSAGGYSEDMRIDSSGDTFINATSDPTPFTAKFCVVGTGNVLTARTTSSSGATVGAFQTGTYNGGVNVINFYNNSGGTMGTISATNGLNGTTVSYNTSSDHRLKENVEDMTGAIDRVKQLLPKRFNFIADDTNTLVDGFLAHEAQSVVAEAVTGTHNEVDDDDNPVMQGIDQAKLVPLLTGALKEAIAKIEALETRVTALENS
jgi:hypothetical protein